MTGTTATRQPYMFAALSCGACTARLTGCVCVSLHCVCAVPCSCGTFDVGATGSEGDTGSPRFGCNASLRKEVGPCLGGPGCWNGVERRFNLSTGAWMNETAFKSVEDK